MTFCFLLWIFIISLVSYLLGSIPFSYLIAKVYGKNLYEVGTGNIGTANVWRATGKIEPTFCALIGDSGKGILALFFAKSLSYAFFPEHLLLAQGLSCFFAVLGHNWPIFLKFKGGRGLATLGGALLYFDWRALLLVFFVITFSIFLVEILVKKGKLELKGTFKEKARKLFSVFISQVLGRDLGILVALVLVFFFFPQVFKIAFPALILAVIKHIGRTKNFLEGKRI